MNATHPSLIAHQLTAATENDAAVDAGRDALQSWWGSRYPWYDAETDGLQRVEVREPWTWDWVPDWNLDLSGLFPATLFEWLVWIALIALLGGVIYLLIRTFLAARRPARRTDVGIGASDEEDDADRVEALPFPLRSGRLDLLGEAKRHYLEGNYGQAVIYLFSFQLVELDKSQFIRLAKGKTNRQYLRELRPRDALQKLLERTMVAFEDVFFGNQRLDRTRFESCWTRLDEFRSLATEGAC